jgi:sphinganine-1-phosphate aldolase
LSGEIYFTIRGRFNKIKLTFVNVKSNFVINRLDNLRISLFISHSQLVIDVTESDQMKKILKLFPEKGQDGDSLLNEMRLIKESDSSWRNGKIFGYVFHPGDEDARVVEEAHHLFCCENALNSSLFGSLRKFENETVAMVAGLLNAGPDAAGSLTSGGTESILMAVKVARDLARSKHPENTQPEIVIPESAHPAFDKVAHYLDVGVVHVPVEKDKRVDIDELEKLISSKTILLVGSAPCYPHGVVDPISEIGSLAVKYHIPFHVDACMGGLMLPFVERLGYPVPQFDFRVRGVTSISADMHKYGYSPKGASVIVYSDHELRKYQFYVQADWSGGIYGSPTMLGTKCGGPIAAAWASIKLSGCEGYLQRAKEVMETVKKIQTGINSIPGLFVISNPEMSLFSFTSDVYDIFALGDELTMQGWHLDRLQFPNALHMTISYQNVGKAEEFLSALGMAVTKVSSHRIRNATSHLLVSFVNELSRVLPEKWFNWLSSSAAGLFNQKEGSKPGKTAAMYGMTASLDNRKNVHEMILEVMDKIYSIDS